MTTPLISPATTTAAGGGRPALAAATVAGYAADWALFTDWATATDNVPLPAEAGTVLAFLADCPAAQATHRRRIAAIDHHHTAAGQPAPGSGDAVRSALGRPTGNWAPDPDAVAQVHQRLLLIPSHGWTAGFFGRRDRFILTLTHLAGLTYRDQHHLLAADITVTGGVLTIQRAAGAVHLEPELDPRVCPGCTAARWLNALHITVTRPATSMLAAPMARTAVVTSTSAHLCAQDHAATGPTRAVPVLVPIDRYGGTDLPLRPLTPTAISWLASVDNHSAHTITTDVASTTQHHDDHHASPLAPAKPRYTRRDHEQAAAKRATAKTQLAGVTAALDALDDALAALDRRIQAALDSGSS